MAEPVALATSDEKALRRALEDRQSWPVLAERLRSANSEVLSRLSTAFAYDLVEPEHAQRRRRVGIYAPVIEAGDSAYPPRLRDVEPDTWAAWSAARNTVDDPAVRARIDDLRYLAEGPRRHAHDRSAAHALQVLAARDAWEPLERADCLVRAIEILTELNDQAARNEACTLTMACIDEMLESQPHPGPPLRLVRALTRIKPTNRPDDFGGIVDRAVARFEGSPAYDGALEVAQAAAADPARRETIRRRRVQARREAAALKDGLAKASALHDAAEMARRYGFSDEAGALLHELQELPIDDEEFERFTAETELPSAEIDAEIDRVAGTGASGFGDALRRIGSYGPPSGSDAEIDLELDKQDRDFPHVDLNTTDRARPRRRPGNRCRWCATCRQRRLLRHRRPMAGRPPDRTGNRCRNRCPAPSN